MKKKRRRRKMMMEGWARKERTVMRAAETATKLTKETKQRLDYDSYCSHF